MDARNPATPPQQQPRGRARRRTPRVRTRLDGSLVGRTTRPVTVLDLSLTGCLVQCESLLDPGTIVDLRVQLDPDAFVVKARVVESSVDGSGAIPAPRYLAGLEWLGLPVREQATLRRFLAAEQLRRSAPRA